MKNTNKSVHFHLFLLNLFLSGKQINDEVGKLATSRLANVIISLLKKKILLSEVNYSSVDNFSSFFGGTSAKFFHKLTFDTLKILLFDD